MMKTVNNFPMKLDKNIKNDDQELEETFRQS